MNHSLQRNLNQKILTATAVFALLASAISGYMAFNEARELQDNLLRQMTTLADLNHPGAELLDPDDDPEDTFILQRIGDQSSQSIPIPEEISNGLHTLNVNGVGWRVLVYTGKPTSHGERYAVSQRTEARDEVAWNSSLHTLLPIVVLAPILLMLVRLAIKQSISQVLSVATDLDQRNESSLDQLPEYSVPEEITPFISAINRLLTRLKRAIVQQRRFIADAAHELRTPVAGLSLLADNLASASSMAEVHQRLAPLQEGMYRTQLLVEQLLDLARAQGEQQNQHQQVSLQRIVQDVIAELFPMAEKKAIDLGMPRNESIQVWGSSSSMQMLIRNAIENAIRYSPAGSPIDVSLFIDGECAILTVEDHGCGIPTEDLLQVFEPFYRVRDNSEPGNGLGLTIAQEAANRLGGRIQLSNRPEGGLCFRYSHPLSAKN